jgi:hypothetical protein
MSHAPLDQPHDAPPTVEFHTPSYSRLLSLPGELRNLICQYALTSSHGLYMNPGGYGQPPRIFEEDPERIISIEENHSEWDSDWSEDLDYTLNKKKDVIEILKPGQDLSSSTFNQIKYTCHQLYQETAGIEVMFNNIRFLKSVTHAYSAETFFDFMRGCKPDKAAWFTNISLEGNPFLSPAILYYASPDWERESQEFPLDDRVDEAVDDRHPVPLPHYLNSIAEYCLQHPSVMINFHLAPFSSDLYKQGYISWGIYVAEVFRGKNLQPPTPDIAEFKTVWDLMVRVNHWDKRPDRSSLVKLQNLRFWLFYESYIEGQWQWDSEMWIEGQEIS